MKRVFVILVAVVMLVGCEKPKPPVVEPVENSVSLARPTIDWNDGAGQYATITTEEAWTAELDFGGGPTWAYIDKAAGEGDDIIRISNTTNQVLGIRRVDLVITFESGDIKRATLTQTFNHREPVEPNNSIPDWIELPAINTDGGKYYVKHFAKIGSKVVRNYSLLYDPETYISYWVAYPLHNCYLGSAGRQDSYFGYDPLVPTTQQVNLSKSYSPSGNPYQRGHQVPYADRSAEAFMAQQTYFCTNMTPQTGSFNGGRWGQTESKMRAVMNSHAPDTMYIVTGAILRTVGGSETITYMANQSDGKVIPVPTYYYKVAIMPSGGSWKGIGFWFEHANPGTGSPTRSDTKTIREIETLTGFNFFTNLSTADQTAAETTIDYSFWGM